MRISIAASLLLIVTTASSFVVKIPSSSSSRPWSVVQLNEQIISPFDTGGVAASEFLKDDNVDEDDVLNQVIAMTDGDVGRYQAEMEAEAQAEATATATLDAPSSSSGPLDLTWENVEMVLDSMREYLIADGGNVIIKEIDGPVVRLELQGNCGTCPSSTQTMKMGLERGLKERIPEISEVVQSLPEGPPLNEEQVDVILDGVRPFLEVAGSDIHLAKLSGVGSLQPTILLHMEGSSAALKSVKMEISQRLQRHFMLSGLHVLWDDDNEDSESGGFY
uniref:NIF system FeS cluster assembly NifU C-terminal domain-containing protein n=1 Tax=Grammatophora oceanica TaxID=210454 RepID=A0A7S1V170_9STRA